MIRRFTKFPPSFIGAEISPTKVRAYTGTGPTDETGRRICDQADFALRDVRSGRALHVFIEGAQMWEWLRDMQLADYKLLSNLRDHWLGSKYRAVCFHWEESVNSFSILLTTSLLKVMSETKIPLITVLFPSGRDVRLSAYDGLPRSDVPSPTCDVYYVLNGLSCYLDAFPECLRDGAPSDITSLVHYGGCKNKGRRMTLSVAPQLQEEHSIAPHFRRGHFRVLKSEKFTRKRGQVVFVRSTFVLGKAQTVTETIAQ